MKQKLLFLGQYPIDTLNSAPKIRTWNLYKEISAIVETDFITGTRESRRLPLLKYIFSGKIFKVDAIYLESATSTSTETDIFLLLIAKIFRKKIGIFIRDAYPMFGIIPKNSLKNRLLIFFWYISIWFYLRLADIIFFPTASFGNVFRNVKHYQPLPPGGRSLEFIPPPENGRGILLATGIDEKRYPVSVLLHAIDKLYEKYNDITLHLVCSAEDKKKLSSDWLNKPWLKIRHLNYQEIAELRENIYLCIIPLLNTEYENTTIPLKVYDYMSLGRAIVAGNGKEVKKVIHENEVGVICEPVTEDIMGKIEYLFENFEVTKKYALNAHKAINEKHLWKHRAEEIIRVLL